MSANTIRSKFLSGGIWVLASTVYQNILQIVLLITFSRLLSPNDFGIVTISLLIVSLFSILSQFGLPQAIIQKKQLTENEIKESTTVILIAAVTIVILLSLLASPLSSFFDESDLGKIIHLITFTVILQSLASIPEALLQRELKFKATSIVELCSYTLGYGLIGLILAFLLRSYYALIYANLLYHLLRFLMLLCLKPTSLRASMKVDFKSEIIKLGIGFNLNRLISFFSIHSDNIIVGKILGTETLGIYSRIYQLISLPAKITGMLFDKLLFSSLSRIQDDKIQTRMIYLLFLRLSGFILIFLSIYIFVFAEEIIYLLLGSNWESAIVPLKIFTFSMFFRTAYKIGETISISIGYVYKRIVVQLVYAISVIISSLVGAFFGFNGVIIGVTVAIIVNFVLITRLTNKILDVKLQTFLMEFTPVILYSSFYFAVLYFMHQFFFIYLNSTIITFLLGGLISILILYVPLNRHIKKIWKTI
ncbi:oligosaccharide flippase family protein [Sporosarcina sp. ZBG7A]|uniref:oligosaccharide flippase family protein n=1 Tax=Sporosarcina sp. ZBG7A TaxID=1582223 RepID=UPI00057B4A76|nr:oligosaccharide flippase family protein [Sporosarcina sp. ZBG7A]